MNDNLRKTMSASDIARPFVVSTTPFLLFSMGHRLIAGPTGVGKSNYVVQCALAMVEQGHWVTFAAPHEQVGIDFISELYARYGKSVLDRLVVIDTRDMDHVVMQSFIAKSTD